MPCFWFSSFGRWGDGEDFQKGLLCKSIGIVQFLQDLRRDVGWNLGFVHYFLILSKLFNISEAHLTGKKGNDNNNTVAVNIFNKMWKNWVMIYTQWTPRLGFGS